MKKQSLKLTAKLLLPAALLALTSCSSTPPEAGRGAIVLNAFTVTAKVTLINADDRTVVLQRPDGSLSAYQCGPEVVNFDQLKVGDQVTATAAEELAIALVKGGLPASASTSTAIVRAPLGDKPGGKIVDTESFTARVVSVDDVKREVTLQMVTGENKTVKVGPDINLAKVKPGHDVGVRLTRAFAIAVSTPGTAAAAGPSAPAPQ